MPELNLDKLDDLEWRLSALCANLLEQVRTKELEKGQRFAFALLIDERKWQLLSVDASKVEKLVLDYPRDGAAIAPACVFCGGVAKYVDRDGTEYCCDECAGPNAVGLERI